MDKLRALNLDSHEDSIDIIKTARRRAVIDKLTTYYKKLIDEEMWDEIYQYETPVIDVMKDLKQKTDAILDTKNGKMNWCFFTINFKEDISHEEIMDVMKKFCETSKYLDNYLWTIEQRSMEKGSYSGFHIHILFSKNGNPPSKIQRAFKTKFFDKYVGNPSCLDYKYVENPEKRINYILGNKDDKEKLIKCKIDEEFRELYGYQRYYVQGELQTLVENFKAD